MQLDQTAIEIRARSPWEALDLGVLMVRRWWRALFGLWLVQVLPLFLLAHLILWGHWEWAPLLIWWLKPLLERPLLLFLSQAIFHEPPSQREVLRQLFGLWRVQLFLSLTWRRFSLTRSLDLPVLLLEGMAGDERQVRLGVLHRRQSQPATWLTVFGAHLEFLLLLGTLILVDLLIPEQVSIDVWVLWAPGEWLQELLHNLLWLAAVSLVAPFYTACGFALYLNRRVELEAWDIELVFRQLAQRLGVWAIALVLGFGTVGFSASSVEAQTLTPAEARESVRVVLESEAFHQWEEVERPVWDDKDEEETEQTEPSSERDAPDFTVLEAVIKFIATFGRLMLWIAGAALLVFLIWRYRDWLREHLPRFEPAQNGDHEPVQSLFGLDLRRESLPEHPGLRAWVLWSEGHPRAGLALLYRATLAALVRQGVPFHEGDTEGDCLARVRRHSLDDAAAYLARLTPLWQMIAYAHEVPEGGEVQLLCHQWAESFEEAADE